MINFDNLKVQQCLKEFPVSLNNVQPTEVKKLENILNEKVASANTSASVKVLVVANGVRFEFYEGGDRIFYYYSEQSKDLSTAISRLDQAITVKSSPHYSYLQDSPVKVQHDDGMNTYNIMPGADRCIHTRQDSVVITGDLGNLNNLNILRTCVDNLYMIHQLFQSGYITHTEDLNLYEEIEVLYNGELYIATVYNYENFLNSMLGSRIISKHILSIYHKFTKKYYRYDSDEFEKIKLKYSLIESIAGNIYG